LFDAHFSTDRAKQFFHSSSYTANPIACAAANANLAIWREEPVLERIATLGRRQAGHLAHLANVSNPRRLGTIAAFEIESRGGDYMSALGPRLLAFFRERDILLRPLGNTIYVMPPYCIDEEDLASIWDAISEAVGASF
jgi:adenosylmethionine-8-amino-7-oxononanoate aminotransferase